MMTTKMRGENGRCSPLPLVFLLLVSGAGICYGAQCREADKQSLLKLREGFISKPGNQLPDWPASSPNCCLWNGIECQWPDRVVGLSLSELIPDPSKPGLWQEALANLTALKTIRFWQVSLNSTVPKVITDKTSLEFLVLDECDLKGPLPSDVGKLTNLNYLSMAVYGFLGDPKKGISGSLPSALCNLTKLTLFNFQQNSLTGRIPDCINKLTNLESISLARNLLSGPLPYTIGGLTKLIALSLDNNFITGPLPRSLGNLKNLQYLEMNDNNVDHELPREIGDMSKIAAIRLSNNRLSGRIPPEFGRLSFLFELDLSFNRMSGEIPASLANISLLGQLSLNNNDFWGNIPPTLSQLCSAINYCTINLSHNRLYGSLPQQFVNVRANQSINEFQLARVTIDVSYNFLSGSLPPYSGRDLYALLASHNKLSGGFPLDYAAIGVVDLSYNNLFDLEQTRQLPPAYGDQTVLQHRISELRLAGNRFVGTFPDWLFKVSSIRVLDISSNRFFGALPHKAFDFTDMTELNASHNFFYQTLPPDPFKNNADGSAIMVLDLHHNSFYGAVHASFLTGKLSRHGVFYLDLSENRLWGSLPNAFGGLGPDEVRDFGSFPKHIDLSNNFLGGPLPDSIGNLKYLEYLDMSSNNFTGTIPSTYSKLKMLTYSKLQQQQSQLVVESSFTFLHP